MTIILLNLLIHHRSFARDCLISPRPAAEKVARKPWQLKAWLTQIRIRGKLFIRHNDILQNADLCQVRGGPATAAARPGGPGRGAATAAGSVPGPAIASVANAGPLVESLSGVLAEYYWHAPARLHGVTKLGMTRTVTVTAGTGTVTMTRPGPARATSGQPPPRPDVAHRQSTSHPGADAPRAQASPGLPYLPERPFSVSLPGSEWRTSRGFGAREPPAPLTLILR